MDLEATVAGLLPVVVRPRRKQTGEVVVSFDVYIGRECQSGGWRLERSAWYDARTVDDPEAYEGFVRRTPELWSALPQLVGQRLGCWCKRGTACHGAVLRRLVAERLRGALVGRRGPGLGLARVRRGVRGVKRARNAPSCASREPGPPAREEASRLPMRPEVVYPRLASGKIDGLALMTAPVRVVHRSTGDDYCSLGRVRVEHLYRPHQDRGPPPLRREGPRSERAFACTITKLKRNAKSQFFYFFATRANGEQCTVYLPPHLSAYVERRIVKKDDTVVVQHWTIVQRRLIALRITWGL